jgi:hypothetical protein
VSRKRNGDRINRTIPKRRRGTNEPRAWCARPRDVNGLEASRIPIGEPAVVHAAYVRNRAYTTSAVQQYNFNPKDWSGEHKTYNLLEEDDYNWQSWRDDIRQSAVLLT